MNFRSNLRAQRAGIAAILLATLSISPARGYQDGFVRQDGERLALPSGQPLLLRGTNLGNWLEPEGYMFHFEGGPQSPREIEELVNELLGPAEAAAFWRDYRDTYITEQDIQFLKRTGVNSLRVPLHYKFFESDDAEGFKLIDRLVEWCRHAGIYLILDLHCAPGGQTGTNIDDSWGYPWLYESPASQQHTIDVWRRIAHHYHDEPVVLGYDLLNEPIPNYPEWEGYNSALEPLYKRITAAIRQEDSHHIIILGGAQWDSNFQVFGPPFDRNVMYTFHKYWTAPTPDVIQEYVEFRRRYRVPIWLGESGENKDEWVAQFTKTLESNDIGWAFWPYKKMDSGSCFVGFRRPAYWDEIIAFARTPMKTGDAKDRIATRPSLEHSRAAFRDLLQAIRFENNQENTGYISALGLHAVPLNKHP